MFLAALYNMRVMEETFRRHGLDEGLVDHIFGAQRDAHDPFLLLQTFIKAKAEMLDSFNTPEGKDDDDDLLSSPPMLILHGPEDETVPAKGSEEMATLLRRAVGQGSHQHQEREQVEYDLESH